MLENYRYELVGAFGDPIDENLGGIMNDAAFEALGLKWRFELIHVKPEDLEMALNGVRAFQMKGINLTVPHKVAGVKYLDELSESAQIIGAVNMIVNQNGKLFGENTDGKGFLMNLENHQITAAGKNVAVLGAGGASRAICVEAALAGAKKITVANIVREQGEDLCALIREKTPAEAEFVMWEAPFEVPTDTDIFVNATSIGLYPNVNDKPNVNYDTVKENMVVCDVIFNDPNTLFLAEARKRGCKTLDGLGMLVNQGALNFEMWTGQKAPWDLMYDTLKKEFGL